MKKCECKELRDKIKGLTMREGRLKKRIDDLESGNAISYEIPDLSPYIAKVDVLDNLANNLDNAHSQEFIDSLVSKIREESNNLRTIFQKLIIDFGASESQN